MTTRTRDDRAQGALLGLAVGDALGAAVEFSPPGTFVPVSGYRSGGPHKLEPGQWTDDTSMALALADSIIEAGWDLNDQAERYVAWWREGRYSVNGTCFDMGFTVRSGLREFLHSGNALTSGDSDERASGQYQQHYGREDNMWCSHAPARHHEHAIVRVQQPSETFPIHGASPTALSRGIRR